MADYTKLHRDHVKNSAEAFGMGEFQDSRFFAEALEATQTGLAWHRLKPDRRSPIAHRHRAQEELYVVVGGAGRAKLDDAVIDLAAGDVLRIDARVARGFEAGPEGLEFLAFGAPVVDGNVPDQGELVDDFWGH